MDTIYIYGHGGAYNHGNESIFDEEYEQYFCDLTNLNGEELICKVEKL